jgi:hypothetical protein
MAKRRKPTEEELQSEDYWAWDSVEVHEPVKDQKALLSIEFKAGELDLVSKAAEDKGQNIIEFVRAAALAASGHTAAIEETKPKRLRARPLAPR